MSEFDTIVIGSGFGGALAAHELVAAGERVLMLERGQHVARGPAAWHPEASAVLTEHFWSDAAVRPDGRPVGAHACVGGPSVFFGGVALRMRPADFAPAAEIVGDSGAAWPVRYAELEPYYGYAERLLDVAGAGGADPIEPPRTSPYPQRPAALSSVARRIRDAGRRAGLRPFPLPLAINGREDGTRAACVRCGTCDTFACAIGAKNDVAARVLGGLLRRGLELRTGMVATRLIVEGGTVTGVRVRSLGSGAEETIRARRFVLAAGALGSAHLVLASGLEAMSPAPAVVGAYLTRHCSAIVYGVFPRALEKRPTFHKQIGFHDLYLGAEDAPVHGRLGALQQMPTPPSTLLEHHLPWRLGGLLRPVIPHLTGLLAMAEDQPRAHNRVRLSRGRDGRGLPQLVVEHRHSARDVAARGHLVRVARRVLRHAGAVGCYVHGIDTFSHAAGTLRMGADPRTSVLDSDGRFRGVENLYVSDASALPTSGAVNPSLTIAANALRVGAALAATSWRPEQSRAAA